MRLTRPSLEAGAFAGANRVFDAYLRQTSPAPLAIAFSGGGDSLALLLAAQSWSYTRRRRLFILHVDHGLQAASADWARHCQTVALALGAPFQRLCWTGPKPATGLPAAARAARHSLLADAARAVGAAVVLMGHTADDVLEARQMRREGATTPEPRAWSPSPAWPEGRGVFILRPLLGARRGALRAQLAQQSLTWIEDPANGDLAYARARARAVLAPGGLEAPETPAPDAVLTSLARRARHGEGGTISWRREDLRDAPDQAVAQALSIASLCAAGGARPPRRPSVDRLVEQIATGRSFTATLAGARLVAGAEALVVVREAGEAARGGLADIPLERDRPQVWDGRFEVQATRQGLRVGALAGRMTHLPPEARRGLADLPAAARKALPALIAADGQVRLRMEGVSSRSLVQARFEAATGQVSREPSLEPL